MLGSLAIRFRTFHTYAIAVYFKQRLHNLALMLFISF